MKIFDRFRNKFTSKKAVPQPKFVNWSRGNEKNNNCKYFDESGFNEIDLFELKIGDKFFIEFREDFGSSRYKYVILELPIVDEHGHCKMHIGDCHDEGYC